MSQSEQKVLYSEIGVERYETSHLGFALQKAGGIPAFAELEKYTLKKKNHHDELNGIYPGIIFYLLHWGGDL